jgi:hypothetical protein
MGRKLKTMTEEKEKVLLVQDRCDRCGSQAWVLVKGMNGELLFCGHHYTKNESALFQWAYDIIDEREFINKKSESSA